MLLNFWCDQDSIKMIFGLVKTALDILRWVVPIGLIVMTSWDLFTKVLNPDNKDAQKKIMNRAIAAVIVFLIPTIIQIVLSIINIGLKDEPNSNNTDATTIVESCFGEWL